MFLLISVVAGVYLHIIINASKPADTEPVQQIVIVKPGQGFLVFSKKLHKMGIINNPNEFKVFAYIKGYEKSIKAGEYILSSAMTPEEILEIVVNGKVRLHRLTIPEGYNLRQIARPEYHRNRKIVHSKISCGPLFFRSVYINVHG